MGKGGERPGRVCAVCRGWNDWGGSQKLLGAFAAIAAAACAFAALYSAGGPDAVTGELPAWLAFILGGAAVETLGLLWHLFRAPYRQRDEERADADDAYARLEDLKVKREALNRVSKIRIKMAETQRKLLIEEIAVAAARADYKSLQGELIQAVREGLGEAEATLFWVIPGEHELPENEQEWAHRALQVQIDRADDLIRRFSPSAHFST